MLLILICLRLLLQDVPDSDVSKLLTTAPLQGPHIFAFVNDAEIQALFVVGDTVHCEVNKKVGILGALMTLVSIYYIFDLDYPRPYSMLLAVVQMHVMEEPYKKDSSEGFKSFSKSLASALKSLPVNSTEADN